MQSHQSFWFTHELRKVKKCFIRCALAPQTTNIWGWFHTFLTFKESHLQAKERERDSRACTDLSRAAADRAAVLLGCSCACRTTKHKARKCGPGPARNKTTPGWLNSWIALAAGRAQITQPQTLLLNSQQNTICSAKQLIVTTSELYTVARREAKITLYDKVNGVQFVS